MDSILLPDDAGLLLRRSSADVPRVCELGRRKTYSHRLTLDTHKVRDMIDGLRQQLTDRELSETDAAKPPNYRVSVISIPASLKPSLPPLETVRPVR